MPSGRVAVGLAVRVGERAADVGGDVEAELARQRRAGGRGPLQDASEIPPVDQLQHQEVAALGDAEVQHLGDVAVGEAHRDVRLVDEHVAELGVRVDGAVDPLEDDGLLEALPAQLRRQEDLGHAAIRDAPNDVVAAVLRHSERETLPLFTIACPSSLRVRRRVCPPRDNTRERERRVASPTFPAKIGRGRCPG